MSDQFQKRHHDRHDANPTGNPIPSTMSEQIRPIQPAPGVYVVRPLATSEAVSKGGIFVPDKNADPANRGEIVFAGEPTWRPEVKFAPQVGDTVDMKRFGFSQVFYRGEWLRYIGANDILGIL